MTIIYRMAKISDLTILLELVEEFHEGEHYGKLGYQKHNRFLLTK
jgi:hypothetical protein